MWGFEGFRFLSSEWREKEFFPTEPRQDRSRIEKQSKRFHRKDAKNTKGRKETDADTTALLIIKCRMRGNLTQVFFVLFASLR